MCVVRRGWGRWSRGTAALPPAATAQSSSPNPRAASTTTTTLTASPMRRRSARRSGSGRIWSTFVRSSRGWSSRPASRQVCNHAIVRIRFEIKRTLSLGIDSGLESRDGCLCRGGGGAVGAVGACGRGAAEARGHGASGRPRGAAVAPGLPRRERSTKLWLVLHINAG